MVDFLRDFIKVLRLSDVRVSSSETIDAMKVSSLIGLEDKNLLKQSLSQSLAKSMREKEIFADCFDNFFKEDFMNIDNSSEEDVDEKTVSDEIYESQPNNDLESLFRTSNKTTLMTSLANAASEVGLKDIKLFTQTGMFTREKYSSPWVLKNSIMIFSKPQKKVIIKEKRI